MVLSIVGVDGAQVTHVILRRRCWYHCRMWEVGLTEGVKRWQSNWWSLKGRRSLCRRKPSQTNHILDTKRHFCRLRICGSLAPKIMDIMLADHRFADSQIHNTHNWKSGTNVLCCNMHIASQYAFCERNMSVGGSVYQV